VGVYENCRHYVHRSTSSGEAIQRCRLSVNTEDPFACPVDCLFQESRSVSGTGWTQAPVERMSNTADALGTLPPEKRKRPRKKK
jgi:hypothetical protein